MSQVAVEQDGFLGDLANLLAFRPVWREDLRCQSRWQVGAEEYMQCSKPLHHKGRCGYKP